MLDAELNKPRISKISQLFYYSSIGIMSLIIVLIIFWQVEQDTTHFAFSEDTFHSTEGNRDFYVNVNFCSEKVRQFTITRYYYEEEENIYYTLPDAKYRTAGTSCFNTRIHTSTDMLRKGRYEYRVFATYEINPIRSNEQQVAVVKVLVE